MTKEIARQRQMFEREAREGQLDKLCATPFGVDVVGITEFIALTGALVGGEHNFDCHAKVFQYVPPIDSVDGIHSISHTQASIHGKTSLCQAVTHMKRLQVLDLCYLPAQTQSHVAPC